MTFHHNQEIIWYRQNQHDPRGCKEPVRCTFLEYRSDRSAKIQIGYVTKVVRTDSLEAVNQ
jgi:hypothetical protein